MKYTIVAFVMVAIGGLFVCATWQVWSAPDAVGRVLVGAGLDPVRADVIVSGTRDRTRPLAGVIGAGSLDDVVAESGLVASGTIEGDQVSIVSEFGGPIVHLAVTEGDEIVAGQIVAELDTRALDAELAKAKAAVAVAEANLANVKAGTHPAQILAAEAGLKQAQSVRDAASSQWKTARLLLGDPQEIELQILQAKADLEAATAQIEQAQAQIAGAEAERDRFRGQGSMEEKALYQAFNYRVEAAQAGLQAAQARQEGAREMVDLLEALRANPLTLQNQVHLAEGQYRTAEQGVVVAEAKLAELEAGPTPEQVAVAEAQLVRAQATVKVLETELDKMTLRAPILGVVTSRSAHAGEVARAGATLLTVANLDEVRLTVYISQADLGRVRLGQLVDVQVDAFPGRRFVGQVAYISQQAEFTPKNIQTEQDRVNMVIAVRIHLDNPDHLLKLGMPADAVFN